MDRIEETIQSASVETQPKISPSAISSMQGNPHSNLDATASTDKTSPSANEPSLPQKLENRKEVEEYYEKSLEKFGNSETNQKFLSHLESQGFSLQGLTEEESKGSYSKYLTRVYSLAEDAGIPPSSAGTIVHRMAELHTLHRYPDDVANGTRLLEQRIDYQDSAGIERHKELDRVIVRDGVHYIQDIKPIHLGEFAKTEEGRVWASQMKSNHGEDFREKIKRGEISPLSGLPDGDSSRAALVSFSKKDVGKHKTQLDTYRQLYQQANPDVKTAKPSVLPYYVW